MKKYFRLLTLVATVAGAIALLISCTSIKLFMGSGTTNLQSTEMVQVSAARAMGAKISGSTDGSSYFITPLNISGKILSVVLPVDLQEDEGIVPFGDGRPDIAPANSTLYDFDLSRVTTLRKDTIGIKPGFVGGQCRNILLIFGYFDVRFEHDGATREARFCYGDTDIYTRGDKLLRNPEGTTQPGFYWYSTIEGFVLADSAENRPADAAKNTYIANYRDDSGYRDQMHYYMLHATLESTTDYNGRRGSSITLNRTLLEDHNLAFTVDFVIGDSVAFTGITTADAFNVLTDPQLIQKFDMKQNMSDFRAAGLTCRMTFEATSKY